MAKFRYSNPLVALDHLDDIPAALRAANQVPDLSADLRVLDGVRDRLTLDTNPFELLGVGNVRMSRRPEPKTDNGEPVAKFPYAPGMGFSWDGDV